MAHLTIINQVYGLYSMHRVETIGKFSPGNLNKSAPEHLAVDTNFEKGPALQM